MIRHVTLVKLSVRLESTREVFLKDVRGNNLLTFLSLWACLGIILAKMWVICSYESDYALFTLVTNVNAH